MQFIRYGEEGSRLYLPEGKLEKSCYFSTENCSQQILEEEEALEEGGIFVFWNDVPDLEKLILILSKRKKQREILWLDASQEEYCLMGSTSLFLNGYRLRIPPLVEFSASNGMLKCDGSQVFFLTPRACLCADGNLELFLEGDKAGSLFVSLKMASESGQTSFRELGCGLRYFTDGNLIQNDDSECYSCVFEALIPKEIPDLKLYLNPLAWYDSQNSYISIESKMEYDTSFESVYGQRLKLSACPGDVHLVFTKSPILSGDKTLCNTYLTFDGEYSICNIEKEFRLLCGNGGTEYIVLQPEQKMRFVSGKAAYFNKDGGIKEEGFTAWVSFLGEKDDVPVYYAQPEKDPFFRISEDDFLPFQEIPVCYLQGKECFPVIPTAIENGNTDVLLNLQKKFLPSVRREQISGDLFTDNMQYNSVTPQGLLVSIQDPMHWDWLGLAISEPVNSTEKIVRPDIAFTGICSRFRETLQNSSLYLVVREAQIFLSEGASIPCKVTENILQEMKQDLPEYEKLIDTVEEKFSAKGFMGQEFSEEGLFFEQLEEAVPDISQEEKWKFSAYCGIFEIVMSGFRFRLNPRCWEAGKTIMIFKYHTELSLRDMAANAEQWCWNQVSGDVKNTQEILEESLKVADDGGELYQEFRQIANSKQWCGILFLNVPVETKDFPAELRLLVGGCDTFQAHHILIAASDIQMRPEGFFMGKSSLSGVIDYEDPVDLFLEDGSAFGYKLQKLTVSFRQSAIYHFSSRSQLCINRMFGGSANMQNASHGNNLIMKGTYQKEEGNGRFLFGLEEACTYSLNSVPLEEIKVKTISYNSDGIIGKFILEGLMGFHEFEAADPFSYGKKKDEEEDEKNYLGYGGFCISMTETDFTEDYTHITLNTAESKPRENGFAARFLAEPSFVYQESKLPTENGYSSVNFPVSQKKLVAPYWGIEWSLNLGNLGNLTDGKLVVMTFLNAWCSLEEEDMALYFGVRMDGSKQPEWKLQQVLQLKFDSADMAVKNKDDTLEYQILLKRFTLEILGMTFPPKGIDLLILGNTEQENEVQIGWYASYQEG